MTTLVGWHAAARRAEVQAGVIAARVLSGAPRLASACGADETQNTITCLAGRSSATLDQPETRGPLRGVSAGRQADS